MDIKSIRKANLRRLIDEQAGGVISRFARHVGTDESYISQILSEKTRGNVGSKLARQIENAYGLEDGSMDSLPNPNQKFIEMAREMESAPENIQISIKALLKSCSS